MIGCDWDVLIMLLIFLDDILKITSMLANKIAGGEY